jgi:peroxin-7
MPSYKTSFNGYSVEYSPFEDDKIAVATAQHFGIIGNGRLYLLQVDKEENKIEKLNSFDTRKF